VGYIEFRVILSPEINFKIKTVFSKLGSMVRVLFTLETVIWANSTSHRFIGHVLVQFEKKMIDFPSSLPSPRPPIFP
jgi:hypothetical protein